MGKRRGKSKAKEIVQGLSQLPQIGRILEQEEIVVLCERFSREWVVRLLRQAVEDVRKELLEGKNSVSFVEGVPWKERVESLMEKERQGKLRRVVNATGVILHTNLGRAPLCGEALERVIQVARGYCTLEYDVETRRRGGRMAGVCEQICHLTGAEAAYVVNNNAAATMLALGTIAPGREVILSRGELVEIGGSFRVPEVMEAAGAKLREVGTTNRTHLADYENALNEDTALLLKVHRSNYVIQGFTKEVEVRELATLGQRVGLPVMVDQGSGAMWGAVLPFGHGESEIRGLLKAGVDLVAWSGDKLFGGPQAGILVGRREWIQKVSKHPMARALRVGKMTLAALEATLQVYREGKEAVVSRIPAIWMMDRTVEELRGVGERILQAVSLKSSLCVTFEEGESAIGGGSLPGITLPTCRLALRSSSWSAERIEGALREYEDCAIVALLDRGRVLLDLRTLFEEDLPVVISALGAMDDAIQSEESPLHPKTTGEYPQTMEP